MELKEYIEMWSQDDESLSTRDKIEIGRKKLFDFEYPIFDPNYKSVFETHFIRKFYMREIGFETEGLFKFQLESWLLINMPYFNKMFESELIDFDPLVNSEMKSDWTKTKDTDGTIDTSTNGTLDRTNNQDTNGTSTSNKFNRELESDTPDSRLAITTADGSGVIEYASKITEETDKDTTTSDINTNGTSKDTSTASGNTITDVTETETYLQNRAGKIGAITYSKMLKEYRESFVRIENTIFDEMQQLFMLVY